MSSEKIQTPRAFKAAGFVVWSIDFEVMMNRIQFFRALTAASIVLVAGCADRPTSPKLRELVQSAEVAGLRVTLELDRATVSPGEPIRARYITENRSGQGAAVSYSCLPAGMPRLVRSAAPGSEPVAGGGCFLIAVQRTLEVGAADTVSIEWLTEGGPNMRHIPAGTYLVVFESMLSTVNGTRVEVPELAAAVNVRAK